ncbi:hypothetical protein HMPREF1544_05396 [Mucor circinelloides 1006PhL]|uniref:Tc1-like transposase DDE domain-containing protein n=1 Tax=Mucor circinelloides f. circinelloides (strain 1006PhL) TaxID=1220926 RepID=S2JH88_MUCC1|nr:hypothetical protein HMPREF1544_05396 [Mucor circinelloides 1006PhL]
MEEPIIEYVDIAEGTDESNKPVPKGTNTAHFVKFMSELLDIMDLDRSLMGSYLVMDNCSIHKSHPMFRKIESRGYRVMYLPPYSPELNPIEQFWAIVKGKMKRHRLMTEENLSSRIADACNDIHFSDLSGSGIGTDLMSKTIIQDPTVINYITTTLANTQNDYHVGNSKWSDGTRSDVVLEPKSSVLNLPPIIVEIQHTVIMLFNVQTMASRFPGGYAFPSEPWAADCIILSKESLGEGNIDTPLNSLIALGLFLTSRALSIVNAPFADDPTMQYLYTLALSHEEDQHNNILLPLLELLNKIHALFISIIIVVIA